VIREVGRLTAPTDVQQVEQDLAARPGELARVNEERVQSRQILDHRNAVPEQHERVEGAPATVEDVRPVRDTDAAAEHDGDRLGADVDRGHRQRARLQGEAVDPGARADVEDLAATVVESSDLDGSELGGLPEVVPDRQRSLDAVIPADRDRG
jgi:hypothetical protein